MCTVPSTHNGAECATVSPTSAFSATQVARASMSWLGIGTSGPATVRPSKLHARAASADNPSSSAAVQGGRRGPDRQQDASPAASEQPAAQRSACTIFDREAKLIQVGEQAGPLAWVGIRRPQGVEVKESYRIN